MLIGYRRTGLGYGIQVFLLTEDQSVFGLEAFQCQSVGRKTYIQPQPRPQLSPVTYMKQSM